jgi:hypothetical protein
MSVELRAKLAAATAASRNLPEPVAKSFASRRAAWIANEQQLAARCYRRASHWLSRDS